MSLRRLVIFGCLGGTAACSAILGDFSVDGGSSPGADASVGDATGDAAKPSDGATSQDAVTTADGGDAGPPLLSCDTWSLAQPIVVEDLSLAASPERFLSHYAVFPAQVGTVRIVAAKQVIGSASSAPNYSVYTVTPATMQVQEVDSPLPSSAVVLDIAHVSAASGGTTAVLTREAGDASGPTYSVTTLDDLMSATGPIPAAFPVYAPATEPTDIYVLPFSTTDVFLLASTFSGAPQNVYTLGVGRASPTSMASSLATVATSVSSAPFTSPRMLHVDSTVYIASYNDLSTPGCTGYAVPDTALLTSMPTPQVIASGQDLGVRAFAPSAGTSAATDVLMLETDFTGQFVAGYKYRAGIVPNASLSTWTSASVGQLPLPPNSVSAPTNTQPLPSWFGDDIMLIGQGLKDGLVDGGTVAPGLALYWINANTGVRAIQRAATAILPDITSFEMAAALPAKLEATPAVWNIVWVEDVADADGGTHEVMMMNQLLCQ